MPCRDNIARDSKSLGIPTWGLSGFASRGLAGKQTKCPHAALPLLKRRAHRAEFPRSKTGRGKKGHAAQGIGDTRDQYHHR
ncbi:hypothetical protein THICB3510078 [Thiomonas sp. CB3]|nr:hypothetical protein THICB3510078 [Thiomonas sp. CB3]